MDDILKNISMEDLEKLKMLLSIIPGNEQKEIVTLRVFKDEYLNLVKNNRSISYYNSVNLAFNYLVDFFGIQHSIQTLQQKNIESFLIHLQHNVTKGYVVYFRNLKAAFNKAKEWDYVKENCFTKVKLPKRQKLAPVFLTSNQLTEISNQIKNKTVKDVVVFAFYTGMRLDEIVNLRWENVDLQNRVITVGDEQFTTKGRNQRFIPMSEEAYEALRRVKNIECRTKKGNTLKLLRLKDDFVFCKENGEKFSGNYFSRRFKRACKTAGLDKSIHFHSLRHSFASNLVQKGVSLYSVKELLGHASISTTEIYSDLNMDSLREAVKTLDTSASSSSSSELRLSAGVKGETGDASTSLGTGVRGKEPQIFRINSGEKR